MTYEKAIEILKAYRSLKSALMCMTLEEREGLVSALCPEILSEFYAIEQRADAKFRTDLDQVYQERAEWRRLNENPPLLDDLTFTHSFNRKTSKIWSERFSASFPLVIPALRRAMENQ